MSVPRQYPGVMVSSTFADLKEHRAALMKALHGQQLHAVAMEDDSALPSGTVLDSSLRKVREAAAYVGIISHRYGQVPSSSSNPDSLSLTHLEYREALRLGRPILIFIMGDDHPVKRADVEVDPSKLAKLLAFREEVKLADGALQRVWREFESLDDFATAATQSVAELRRLLEERPAPEVSDGLPVAPELYAQPRYLGSHPFVGRQEQLTTLNEWASAAESRTVLLFEAIGGTGKSILTWEWINHYAPGVRDWAGRFWYSFYEAGAVMSDFCRHALAYMTGQPLSAFAEKRQPELGELLLRQLESRPWLLVLDGLERVLVAYQRYDAAQLLDEDAGAAAEIDNRHPCATIRPEDEGLLRRLAAASPSKILVSSRLVPQVLLNQASQTIPGVLHERLPGMRPPDAEALLRGCGVTGDGRTIRAYLQKHCDCHPLVTGIVAGLVNGYLPARGDFDAWASDMDHGGRLDMGELDLVQKRNHILHAALSALPTRSHQLLSTIALLSEAVDYDTLRAVSPQMAADQLGQAITDLEQRGLLQYDRQSRQYDLHPVVRGVAAGGLREEDRQLLGQHLIDHFSSQASGLYADVRDLGEVRGHITLVRTLVQTGRMRAAYRSYTKGLHSALLYKLEAAPEILSLLRPFFGQSWVGASLESWGLVDAEVSFLKNHVGSVLLKLDDWRRGRALFEEALDLNIKAGEWQSCVVNLTNIGMVLKHRSKVAKAHVATQLALALAVLSENPRAVYTARFRMFESLHDLGRTEEAEAVWSSLDLTRKWDGLGVRAGTAELSYAERRFDMGLLTDDDLKLVDDQARVHGNGAVVRGLHRLRGLRHLEREEWAAAVTEFEVAVSMARQSGMSSETDESCLALARLRLGRLPDAAAEIERLMPGSELAAELWHAFGDRKRAVRHALAAYRSAWADGEPYVRRFSLNRAAQLLNELGEQIPVLPPYDPANDPPLPYEARLRQIIDELGRR